MIAAARALGAAFALALCAGPAFAHAFGARYDLPLPLSFYLFAAGLAVAASFVLAAVFVRGGRAGPRFVDIPLPPRPAAAALAVSRALGVAVLAVLLAAAALGRPEATGNLATVSVWVLWWVGFLLFSALVADVWQAVDPFRTLALAVARLRGRAPRPLPRAAGLIAPAGVLLIAWVELVSDWSEDPRALGLLMLAYLAAATAGALAFGRAWFDTADPLARLFELVGRMAPLRGGKPAAIRLSMPAEGLLAPSAPKPGETALVAVLIGMVLFDGLSETPAWAAALDFVATSQTLRGTLLALRDAGVDLLKLLRSIGLLAAVAGFLLACHGLAALMRAASGAGRPLAADFAATLLPIAIAYHLSHYVSYLLIAGQLAAPAASDPFALGWDLFGAARRTIDISVIGAGHVWRIALAAIIAGHALSVLVAHRRALLLLKDPRRAARSQLPMMAAMVGLTMLSLWILSQPIVQ